MNDESILEPVSPTVSQQTKRHRSRCLYLNEVNEGEGRGNVLRGGKSSLAWDDFIVHSMTRSSQGIYTSKFFSFPQAITIFWAYSAIIFPDVRL